MEPAWFTAAYDWVVKSVPLAYAWVTTQPLTIVGALVGIIVLWRAWKGFRNWRRRPGPGVNLSPVRQKVDGLWEQVKKKVEKLESNFELTLTEKTMLVLTASALIFLFFGGAPLWLPPLFIGLTGVLVWVGWNRISADPPEMGIRLVLGKTVESVIKPRITFALPVLEEFVRVKTTQINRDFVVRVHCAAESMIDPATGLPATEKVIENGQTVERARAWQPGGEVDLTIGLTFEPDSDRHRAYSYVTAGKEEGVQDALTNMIGEALRTHGAQFTWEELQVQMPELSAGIITMVTGTNPTVKVARDANGVALRDMDRNSPARFKFGGYLGEHEAPTREDVMYFLDQITANGESDVRGLGTKIRRANASDFKLVGALAEDSAMAAREKQQRRGEKADFETEEELVKDYLERATARGDKMTYQQALQNVQVNRKRATRMIFEGLEGNPFGAAFAANAANNTGTQP